MKETKTKLPNRKYLKRFLTLFIALGIIVGFGIYMGLDYYVPSSEGNENESGRLYDLVRTTVTILGVITVGGAAAVQYRKQLFLEISSELDRDTKHTALLTKAIEHLGDSKSSVQKGGLYELKRLALDSEKDCHDILEIIVGFISEYNDRANDETEKNPKVKSSVLTAEKIFRFLLENEQIQEQFKNSDKILNFSNANLERRNLSFLTFPKVDFRYAKLNYAKLNVAKLNHAELVRAELNHVELVWAELRGADLRKAELRGADLRWAKELEAEQLLNSHIDENTKFDDDIYEELVRLGKIKKEEACPYVPK
ncbi:MAG: pentapeptide repeat-containing protein [Oscillospiraceae bacterium]|nr:pentapeptide repeat-containing protein [Oscillospiraceae bacterium]